MIAAPSVLGGLLLLAIVAGTVAAILITRWARRRRLTPLEPLDEWPPPLSSYIREYRRVP